jgi:hypothetical protein
VGVPRAATSVDLADRGIDDLVGDFVFGRKVERDPQEASERRWIYPSELDHIGSG